MTELKIGDRVKLDDSDLLTDQLRNMTGVIINITLGRKSFVDECYYYTVKTDKQWAGNDRILRDDVILPDAFFYKTNDKNTE